MRSGLLKGLKIGGGVFAFAFVAIGALHMPFAKSLLVKVGDCPVRATPDQVDALQKAQFDKDRGTTDAPVRPALGFTLEQTMPDEVLAWGTSNKVACAAQRDNTIILCSNVPSALIGQDGPPVEEVQFDFRATDHKLHIVSTFRGHMTRPEAAGVLSRIDANIAKQLGEPTLKAGSPALDKGPAGGFYLAYNFKNYKLDTSASSLGEHGFGIREHYISAND